METRHGPLIKKTMEYLKSSLHVISWIIVNNTKDVVQDPKPLSLLSKSTQSKLRIVSKLSLLAGGLHRGSAIFKVGKGGFKTPRYQNTYRLESQNPFNCEAVDKILEEVMSTSLKDVKYNPTVCLQICQDMSATVRTRVFKKSYERYKYAVIMTIVQKLGQHVQIDFGKLWDVERDTYSTYVYETPEYVALGLVVAMYYE